MSTQSAAAARNSIYVMKIANLLHCSRGSNVMSPALTPDSDAGQMMIPSFNCVVRMPSTSSPVDRSSNSPLSSEQDTKSEILEAASSTTSSRRDR